MSLCHFAIDTHQCINSIVTLCNIPMTRRKKKWNQCQHTRVCRKIEDKASQEGEEHAWDDDVDNEV